MRRNIETGKYEEQINSELINLWRRFGFKGEPPKSGSVAENRLKEKCESYTAFVTNPKMVGATGSDGYRRQLHNEIAIMVSGIERTGMDFADADAISEFAVRFATGMSRKEAIEAFENKE